MPISNIVQNGGFETGSLSPWNGRQRNGTATGAATNRVFDVDHDSAHSGNWGLSVSAQGSRAFLEQDLHTTAGTTYELTFWVAATQEQGLSANANAAHPLIFEVHWNGSLLFQTFTPPTTYTEFDFTGLVATSNSTDLRFGFRDDFGVFHFDDVKVGIPGVPEPFSTFWFALPVIGMIGFARFSRKRRD